MKHLDYPSTVAYYRKTRWTTPELFGNCDVECIATEKNLRTLVSGKLDPRPPIQAQWSYRHYGLEQGGRSYFSMEKLVDLTTDSAANESLAILWRVARLHGPAS